MLVSSAMMPLSSRKISLDWIVLSFTALASGAVFAIAVLTEMVGLGVLPANYLLPFLPGAALGGVRFLTQQSPARVVFTAVAALVMGGLIWTRSTEFLDGLLLALSLILTMAVSVLYNSGERWTLAAKWFTVGALISSIVLAAAYFQQNLPRFGNYFIDGKRIVDPNLVGAFYAIVVIVQLHFVWNNGRQRNRDLALRLLLLGWFLTVILLTGSRTAQLTALSSIVVFFLFGWARKNRRILLSVGGLGAIVMIAIIAFQGPPEILQRFSGDNVGTFGGRFQIWGAALQHMNDWGLVRALFGEGTGSSPYAIGSSRPELAYILYMDFYSGYQGGVPRVNAHSAYFEWMLTFGLIGAVVGLLLLFNALFNCLRVDWKQPGATAFAFLTVFLLTSITLIAFRMVGVSIACGGITLGYIYMSKCNAANPTARVRMDHLNRDQIK